MKRIKPYFGIASTATLLCTVVAVFLYTMIDPTATSRPELMPPVLETVDRIVHALLIVICGAALSLVLATIGLFRSERRIYLIITLTISLVFLGVPVLLFYTNDL